jgi:hypothetical protein
LQTYNQVPIVALPNGVEVKLGCDTKFLEETFSCSNIKVPTKYPPVVAGIPYMSYGETNRTKNGNGEF